MFIKNIHAMYYSVIFAFNSSNDRLRMSINMSSFQSKNLILAV